VLESIRDFFSSRLGRHRLPEGVSVQEAADYIARMLLSFMASPTGRRSRRWCGAS
jgi:hypothetical protein